MVAVDVAPSGELAISACLDGSLGIWNIWTGELVRQIEAHDAPLADVRLIDEGTAVSVAQDRRVRNWNIRTGEQVHGQPLTTPLDSVAVAPSLLAVGDRGGNLWLFDRPSPLQLIRELQGRPT